MGPQLVNVLAIEALYIYIKLCNDLSRIVIVFGALLLEVAPLKRQMNIALYFEYH